MPVFKRFSDVFWSLVAPDTDSSLDSTPQRRGPDGAGLHADYDQDGSTSPRYDTPGQELASGMKRRKREHESSADLVSGMKRIRIGNDTTDSRRSGRHEDEEDSDLGAEHQVEEDSFLTATMQSPDHDATTMSLDPDAQPRVISIPEMQSDLHVSTEELRAQGHDDDYIVLMQKIAMRGYEPLLPNYFKFDYSFLPDGLFETADQAFIGSVRENHFLALKALERLLEVGGRMRDRVEMNHQHARPEEQLRRQLVQYNDWAQRDARIDSSSSIPLFAIESQPANTPPAEIQRNATRRCQKLAARYRDRLRVVKSVEGSPGSVVNGELPYPLPTIYAVVASHTFVAIMAYKPQQSADDDIVVGDMEPPVCTPMAVLKFDDKGYDVWNALALAIVTCHVRNVQLRLAEETGIGLMVSGDREAMHRDEFDDDE